MDEIDDDEYWLGLRWDWLADAGLAGLDVAACITFVRGATREQVLEAFGADTDVALRLDDGPRNRGFDGPSVAVAPFGEGWIAIEPNGGQGSLPEVLGDLAALGATAASMYWDVNGMLSWSLARDGVVSTVDPYDPDPESCVGDPPPEVLEAFEAAEDDGDDYDDLRRLGVELAAQQVGLPLLPAPHASSLLFHPVIPRPPAPADARRAVAQWEFEAPHLARRIADAGPFAQRALAEWAAQQAITRLDIAADPRTEAVLEQFGRGTAASFEPAQSLFDETHRESERRLRSDPSRAGGLPRAYYLASEIRLNAMLALRDACNLDALAAALAALPRSAGTGAFTEAEMREQAQALLDGLSVPPAAGIDEPPEDPDVDDDLLEYLTDRDRADRMARGLETDRPDETEPEPAWLRLFTDPRLDPVDADPVRVMMVSQWLLESLAAWETAWRAAGAPVDEQLAPGLPPDVVRATLEGLPVASTEIAQAWFGWHDGATPAWHPFASDPSRLLSIEDSLRARERAQAVVAAYESEQAFGAGSDALVTRWFDSYLPLLGDDEGGTLGVDLDSGLVWIGAHPAPGSGGEPTMQRLELTLDHYVDEQASLLAEPSAPVWADGRWQRGPSRSGAGGVVIAGTLDDAAAAGRGAEFGWVSYGPDGPFIVSGDAGVTHHSGGFTFTAMSSGDVDDGGYEHEEPGVAAPEPDPQRVRADALRLPALLAAWEREWRDRGADVGALLHPGVPADRVRLELRRAGVDADSALAEIWFGWHNGTVDARFQAEASHNVLLSLDEALHERRLIEEAMAHPEWHWTAHTSAPLFPGFLPLLSDMRTEHIRYTLAIDLGSSTLWTTHWEPDGSAQIRPVPTTPMHTPTVADTVETNWLHSLREDDVKWNGKRWR